MKVLHIGKFYPPQRGGMESHLATLADGLRHHVDLEIVVAGSDRRSTSDVVDGISINRLGTLAVAAATPLCPGLFGVMRHTNADLVHLHHPHPLAMFAYLRHARHIPAIVSYHSDIVRQRVLGAAVAPVVRATLSKSQAILVASRDYLDSSATLASFRHKCHTVPYGIDLSVRKSVDAAAVAEIRARFGRPIVLAVGRLVYYKGFDVLVRAMTEVDAHLLIIGSGPLRGDLLARVEELQLTSRISMLGDVEDLQPYYDACDVFVLPSVARSEAFGIVQLEAMAAGKPIVNTALGSGVNYVCPHAECALTVPPSDPQALAAALNVLLRDEALRHRLGEAGLKRVKRLFTSSAMVTETLNVYRHALSLQVPS